MPRPLAATLVLSTLSCCSAGPAANEPVIMDTSAHAIEFRAVYHPRQFNGAKGLQQHHLVVWAGGKAAGLALLDALSADSSIHDALVAAGAVPGNNLTRASWERRSDPRSPDPHLVAAGSALRLSFRAHGREVPADSLLADLNGRPFHFCFAGNRALIPVWRSGCVVCLQSCPGSKVSNRTYTMRDLYKGTPRFAVRGPALLRDGDTVVVRAAVEERR